MLDEIIKHVAVLIVAVFGMASVCVNWKSRR